MQSLPVLLSTAYFAPIQYYSKLIEYDDVCIEQHENYCKQSYRNRCKILSANGILDLSVPVIHEGDRKIPIREVKIDNSTRWKQIHWRAIESAYRSSPFFLYYSDDIYDLLFKDYENLFELNDIILKHLLELLNIQKTIRYTTEYKNKDVIPTDFSESIHPKARMQKPDNKFVTESYYQVFESKFGFIPNLSILDLLFNMGPTAESILKKCIKI